MSNEPNKTDDQRRQADEFEQEAERRVPGLAAEFAHFLIHNKKWWLAPIILVLLLFGALVILGSSGVLPFIYPV